MSVQFEQIISKDDESFFIGIFQDNLEKGKWHYPLKVLTKTWIGTFVLFSSLVEDKHIIGR